MNWFSFPRLFGGKSPIVGRLVTKVSRSKPYALDEFARKLVMTSSLYRPIGHRNIALSLSFYTYANYTCPLLLSMIQAGWQKMFLTQPVP